MATTTANYGLTKPAATDFYDVSVQNGNMDKIDAALAAKAPAGYGLGADAAVRVDDLAANGYMATQNTPDGAWAWGQQVALNYNLQSQLLQRADGCILQRTRTAGVWGEPEWLNPPMVSGVEYRLTERYRGKVVYTKSLNAGALPANTYKDVSLGVTITDLVDLKVCIQSSTVHMLLPDVENKVYAKVMWAGSVRIFALEADMSTYTGRITIKYTKD